MSKEPPAEEIYIGPGRLNVKGVRAGDRNPMNVYIKDGYDPTDLTDTTVTAQARPTPEDETTFIDAIVTVLDPKEGNVELRWPGADVRAALGTKRTVTWWWDLQVLPDSETEPETKVYGEIEFNMDVTRPDA